MSRPVQIGPPATIGLRPPSLTPNAVASSRVADSANGATRKNAGVRPQASLSIAKALEPGSVAAPRDASQPPLAPRETAATATDATARNKRPPGRPSRAQSA